MPNRTCWDVYIMHLNNTNVSMLHLLFIFVFFYYALFVFVHLLVFFSPYLRTGIVYRLATISFLLLYFGVLSVYGVKCFDVMLFAAKPSNFVLRCIVYLVVLCHQFQI